MPSATQTPDDASSPGEAWRWWEGRRLRYNLGLAVAGWIAWACWTGLAMWLASADPTFDFRPSFALTLSQGLAFMVVMALANLCYLLGAIGETLLRPQNVPGYRSRMFNLGFWFSFAVPFLFPLAMVAQILWRFEL